MDAAVSSQTSVYVYQIIRYHIPDDSNHLNGRIDYGYTGTCITHQVVWGVDIWPQ